MMPDLIASAAKLISGANVRWHGCAPEAKQRIYFANHTSHLDAVVLWASLPKEIRELTRPVAARDYWVQGKIRPYLATRIFHAVLIERVKVSAHDNPVEQMADALGQTHSLIIFPEGTRSTSGEIGAFKGGLFHLARRRPDIELVPVLIDNLNRILPKGEFLPVPLLSGITFGTPLRWEEKETKEAFLTRAHSAVTGLRNL